MSTCALEEEAELATITETEGSQPLGATPEEAESESEPEQPDEAPMPAKKRVTIQLSSSSSDSDEGLTPPSTDSSVQYGHRQALQYRLYPWRWFMLVSLCLLNISNGTMWLTFAPIPDYTSQFYDISVSQVDWFSITYFIVSLVIGLFSIYILDTWGLRVSIYLGAVFNFTGSLLRYISTFDPIVCSSVWGKSGFLVAMTGQFLTACAQPFILYAPTMLAGLWFGTKERAICTNFASIANPIGLAIAQLVSPYVVKSIGLQMLLLIYTIPAALSAILTAVAFWWPRPSIPPAPSSVVEEIPFFRGILKTLTCFSFWVLLVVWGVGAGLFNALITLLPQILCPFGYSDQDAGLWGALMIFCGLVGATIVGVVIDYTKWFKEVAVVTLTFAILSLIWFYEVFSLHDQAINIAFSLCLFGFFALPLIPACMELGVEITYPVPEATSSGLLWSVAQILGIILVTISQVLQFDVSSDQQEMARCGSSFKSGSSHLVPYCVRNQTHSHSTDTPKDLSYAMLLYVCLIAAVFLFFVLAFHPRYRRTESDRRSSLEESVFLPDSMKASRKPFNPPSGQ